VTFQHNNTCQHQFTVLYIYIHQCSEALNWPASTTITQAGTWAYKMTPHAYSMNK